MLTCARNVDAPKGKSEANGCAWTRLHESIRTLRLLTTTTAKDKGMHTVEMHQKKMEDQGTLVLLLVNKIATDETTLNQNQSATIIKTPQQDASDACKTSTDPQETTTGTTETPPPSHHRNTTEIPPRHHGDNEDTTGTPPEHNRDTGRHPPRPSARNPRTPVRL